VSELGPILAPQGAALRSDDDWLAEMLSSLAAEAAQQHEPAGGAAAGDPGWDALSLVELLELPATALGPRGDEGGVGVQGESARARGPRLLSAHPRVLVPPRAQPGGAAGALCLRVALSEPLLEPPLGVGAATARDGAAAATELLLRGAGEYLPLRLTRVTDGPTQPGAPVEAAGAAVYDVELLRPPSRDSLLLVGGVADGCAGWRVTSSEVQAAAR
jgi:hypothetical protein